jgi:hypothetical protein
MIKAPRVHAAGAAGGLRSPGTCAYNARMPLSDRAFRALARAEPGVVVALLRVVAPDVMPPGATADVDDVMPTQLDALPPPLDLDWAARVAAHDLVHVECQGYRDPGFPERLLWYHLHLATRHRPRRVRTVALWLLEPPPEQQPHVIVHHDITVRVVPVVLPRVPVTTLLADPATACFAAVGEAGGLDEAALCARVVAALRAGSATYYQRHMAVIAAAMAGRYESMVAAMEHAQMEPVLIEDLVKFGEDRGQLAVITRQFQRRLGRALTETEHARLRHRLGTVGVERLSEVVLELDPAALAAWVSTP